MADSPDLERLRRDASALVEAARRAGAEACDVVVAASRSRGVQVRDGKVENTGGAESDDFSLRVFVGKKVASVSAGGAVDRDALAERAVAMARVAPDDPFQGLAPTEALARDWPDLDLYDDTVPEADELLERAMACEAAGLEVPGVARSMGAGAGWSATGFVLATSTGFQGAYARSGHSVSAAMLAGEGTGMERDGEWHSAVHRLDLEDPQAIGRRAGERAVRRLNPRQVASGRFPVLFDRRAAGGMLGALMGAINGASVARRTSFLRDRMGQPVASAAITVRDDPLRRRGLGSRPVDGEGMATHPLTPVEGGVLQTWTLDWASARELGLESNARASRGSSGTSPSTTNCWIVPGEASPQAMMAAMGTGLLVTETIGHGVNGVTGDYSKGASGFWIENGEPAFPVAEITIAGNLKDMFLAMTPADDLQFRGSMNAPSLLVEGMTIGGR